MEVFDNLKKQIEKAFEECEKKGIGFRYVFSFYIFDPKDNEPIADYTGAYGSKETILKVLDGLRENLEMEPGEFINV